MKESEAIGAPRRSEQLFVVRFWHEQAAGRAGQWRGSVVHVTSGQSRYFANLADLTEFIMLQRDTAEGPGPSHEAALERED